jgi:hypothetical protein
MRSSGRFEYPSAALAESAHGMGPILKSGHPLGSIGGILLSIFGVLSRVLSRVPSRVLSRVLSRVPSRVPRLPRPAQGPNKPWSVQGKQAASRSQAATLAERSGDIEQGAYRSGAGRSAASQGAQAPLWRHERRSIRRRFRRAAETSSPDADRTVKVSGGGPERRHEVRQPPMIVAGHWDPVINPSSCRESRSSATSIAIWPRCTPY